MAQKKRKTNSRAADLVAVEREVPLRYMIPEGIQATFSDAAFFQHTEDQFIVSFFQVSPPVTEDSEIPNISEVRAYCVGRIIMTPNQMRKFVNAAAENLARYEEKLRNKGDQS